MHGGRSSGGLEGAAVKWLCRAHALAVLGCDVMLDHRQPVGTALPNPILPLASNRRIVNSIFSQCVQ
ncbi:hypothetical protein GN956_G19435 [Arapaima gigas]